MTIPTAPTAVPDIVAALARGSRLVPVWRNQLGGLTFRAEPASPERAPRYIKWGPLQNETSMAAEARRLIWAEQYVAVPHVIEQGDDATHEWLVTAALEGESAVAPRWIAEPATAVAAVGRGLRALHDVLPVEDCPFDWGVESRIVGAAARGIRLPDSLTETPDADRLVVCHGDACCPNTLITAAGEWSGHVDLGALGVADRWADIAVASMSTEWNYGPGWEDALIEAYGLEPDRERIAYYRDLWNAT
ncbi:aminoglycoside 3'-phosphotransferase [Paramicrobacterium fandaimingii]|uniref:aminoglycoside 3'-phosphotransferase n=1 Tax=Paramicrobacterium fandaimingii TaxID=2708079 RepID=UPI001422A00A|nr:aminoglycoside 3'-phosphotransferase [Microbacterium fandaimingii]